MTEPRNVFGPITRRGLSEEALGALHAIVAILLFNAGWDVLAWLFVVRAVIDEGAALKFSWSARKQEPDHVVGEAA